VSWRVDDVAQGFDELLPDPLNLRVFGKGWYFSKYAAHAQHYTGGSGCVLLAEVAVGNAETVVRRDAARGAPSAGFDSIAVPGRPLPSQAQQRGASTEINEGAPAATATRARRNAAASALRRPCPEAAPTCRGAEYVIFDGSQARPLSLLFFEVDDE
jgi:hypothetical protein